MLNIRKCREQYSVTAMLIATTLGGPVCLELRAQAQAPGVPSIAASTKGPNQINLTWDAISNPGYGYLVEIQSASDRRYSAWQEMRPIPLAGGYQCDNTVQINGAYCNISDPSGIHCCPRWNGPVVRPAENTLLGGTPVGYLVGGLRFELSRPVQVIPKLA